ncbi:MULTISPECIES: hypothetical protein [unclassified Roseovarius]|uniref:hypothetical protein n=1 Tax=unclassified Roseovarius TaxID=2614913 RepID=UPI0027402CDC|nr:MULTISPECIES: hypothetical protein [unclassified Roseovarius]
MSKIQYDEHLADLKGSKQHHDLKNRPGEAGDPNHAENDGELSDEVASAIAEGEGDTQIADALREAAEKDG